MNTTPERLELRLPADLKNAFLEAAQANDRTAAQVLRDFMREYVKRNAQRPINFSEK